LEYLGSGYEIRLASGANERPNRGIRRYSSALVGDGHVLATDQICSGHNGIVWATAPTIGDANREVTVGVVRAYDASNFGPDHLNSDGVPQLQKIWQSPEFVYSKFCPPVVVDGRLIVPTYEGRVDVYVLTPTSTGMMNSGTLPQ
jgi:outer membrane protein assembly factor BamB